MEIEESEKVNSENVSAESPVKESAVPDESGDTEMSQERQWAEIPYKPAQIPSRRHQFLQFLKFALFSASAGIIQFLLQSTLFDWTHVLTYWQAYPIALTASVIWNFTFNRKFTFKASSNVPIAMTLVVIYNLLIVVPFAILGEYLVGIWGDDYGMIVTVILLLINFVTEFFWDKFVVFNDSLINAIAAKFSRRKKSAEDAVEETVEEHTEETIEESEKTE